MKILLDVFISNWILFTLMGVTLVLCLLSYWGLLGEKLKSFIKSYWLLVLAFVLIIFSIFAPYYFTKPAKIDRIDFTDTGAVGDTINGIMGPFIAIAAALLTFAAFIVQKQANDIQIKSISDQVIKDEIDSFENRVFKLIDAHRENVKDLALLLPDVKNGQQTIDLLCKNIEIIISFENWYEKEKGQQEYTDKEKRIFAFLLICHGKSLITNNMFSKDPFKKYANKPLVEYIYNKYDKISDIDTSNANIPMLIRRINGGETKLIDYHVGYINDLSRYFRQIFQIVKYIDSNERITQDQKYEYCKLLRTTLSNKEQELLFNNILSPYGIPWEKGDYIRKYKIFKNITSYTMIGYTPVDFLKETCSYDESSLKEALDFYDYIKTEE